MCAEIKCAPKDSRPLFLTQEKKLKNWYIQEYTTGTTFEPNILKTHYEEVMKPTMVDFNNKVLND